MKKQVALAVILAAALCIAPLAACAEQKDPAGKAFNMADYVTELPDSLTAESYFQSTPDFASVKRIDGLKLQWFNDYNYNYPVAEERGTGENNGLSRLYSLKEEKAVSGWYNRILTSHTPFLILLKQDDSSDGSYSNVFQIATPAGRVFPSEPLPYEYYNSLDLSGGGYYDPDIGDMRLQWYGISYTAADGVVQTEYVGYANGEWKDLSAEDVGLTSSSSSGIYQPGDTLGIPKTPLADPDTYPNYIYKDYSYTREGNNGAYRFTFYKGESKLGSVTVFGGLMLGVVGKYFYYYEAEAVSAVAENGYNVEYAEGYSTQKANMTLCRYDFTSGKTEKVERNYFYATSGSSSSMIASALYNKRTNDFDHLTVRAFQKTDGVAVVSDVSPCYTFILDDEALISFDLTAKSISSSSFYQLSEERFLSGTTILDKEMNTVAHLPSYNNSPKVWKAQSLILVSAASSECFAVDYNGKVVIAGISSLNSCIISGGNLVAKGQSGETLVFSKTAPTGKTLNEVIGAEKSAFISSANGLLFIGDDNVYIFYSCGGKKIGEFTGYVNVSSGAAYGAKYFCTATDENGEPVTLIFQ